MTLRTSLAVSAVALLLAGCGSSGCNASTPRPAVVAESPAPRAAPSAHAAAPAVDPDDYPVVPDGGTREAGPAPAGMAVATFAGGCFWCMEGSFEHVDGVVDAISGYTGGTEQHPTYDDVSNHRTSQAEAIRVIYNPAVVTYDQLLDVFWRRIDPTGVDRAFSDIGHQYRSAVFVHDAAQRAAATRTRAGIAALGHFTAPITTTIEDAGVFWVAEDYHQNFWRTHPNHYAAYHDHSGRREFLREHWGPDAPY
jgi:methionine-S-sulfoxide reductase